MASKYIAAVWAFPGLTATEKLVALYIADQANGEGTCSWCPVREISIHCVMTERTVFRTLKELENKNVIARDVREATNGGRKATKFTFTRHLIATVANRYLTQDQGGTDPVSSPPPDIMSVIPDIGSGGDDPMSVSPTPPYNDLTRTDTVPATTDGAARAEEIVHKDFKKVWQAGCDIFPILKDKTPAAIHNWLNAGLDADMDIIPQFALRRQQNVIKWGYFTKMVYESHLVRTAPPPEIRPGKSAGSKEARTLSALAEVAAKYGIKPEEVIIKN